MLSLCGKIGPSGDTAFFKNSNILDEWVVPKNMFHQVPVHSVLFIHSGIFFLPHVLLHAAPESSSELGNKEFDLLSATKNNMQLVKHTSPNFSAISVILVS